MPLESGRRLGRYEILSRLGAGGMGEVYLARDTRLERKVAVKVLPEPVAADPERRARFEGEARAVATLNHPHVCALYDVGRADGPDGPFEYLVMERLEGETLTARIGRGPIPTPSLLEIGGQIAARSRPFSPMAVTTCS
jgi:serine/threonine protein kinase